MKWKRTALFVACLPAVIFLWREGSYVRSLQYKLDRIVASGRTSFELREVLGDDWKTLCFLPSGYHYPVTDESQQQLQDFLESVLKRHIQPLDDWNNLMDESGNIAILTDKGRIKGYLQAKRWQGKEERGYVAILCTDNTAKKAYFERKGPDWVVEYDFERWFELKK